MLKWRVEVMAVKLYALGLVLMVLIPVLLALGIALNIYQGLGF